MRERQGQRQAFGVLILGGAVAAWWAVAPPAMRAAAPPLVDEGLTAARSSVAGARAAAAADGALTIEKLIDIKHPSAPAWSPDGRHVAFQWERAGVANIWISDISRVDDGGGELSATAPRVALESGGDVGAFFWGADSRTFYIVRGGGLFRGAIDSRTVEPVWTKRAGAAQITLSPDRTRIAYVREGDIWVRSLEDKEAAEVRITSTPEVTEGGPSWSPDGARLAFSAAKVARKEYAPEYSGAKILYTVTERTPLDIQVAAVPPASASSSGSGSSSSSSGGSAPAAITIAPSPMVERQARWVDATHLVFERVSQDTTTREIVIADAATGAGRVIVSEVDPKWWSVTPSAQPGPQPSPDGRWIAFISDRDGWDRVYVVSASAATGATGASASAATEPVAVSPAGRESWRPSWSPDGTRLVFDGNTPETPGVRQVFTVAIANGRASGAPVALTSGRGTNVSAMWSPDSRAVVYQHTDPRNSADLFVTAANPATTAAKSRAAAAAATPATAPASAPAPARLSDSLEPSGVDRTKLIEPTLVSYAASDGQKVPAYLFLPPHFDRTKKYPAIVWIHGDGVNQNYDGWHIERNYAVYYSFHQYLLQQGYVVLTPDYRGSIGYGKAWRQGVYLDVGGKDYEDAALGARYLKSLGYVDGDRIGVWGLSYGGFFTLLAVTNAPREFACAVDVAGVADYAMYYEDPWKGAWTYGRMRAPEDNPKQYAVASPLSHMDRLERPLLILHGTADVNVPYLHSIRLADTLLKLGKDYDFVTYPGEFHYFTRAHVLRDAWTRVDRFFAKHLKPPLPSPVTSEPQ